MYVEIAALCNVHHSALANNSLCSMPSPANKQLPTYRMVTTYNISKEWLTPFDCCTDVYKHCDVNSQQNFWHSLGSRCLSWLNWIKHKPSALTKVQMATIHKYPHTKEFTGLNPRGVFDLPHKQACVLHLLLSPWPGRSTIYERIITSQYPHPPGTCLSMINTQRIAPRDRRSTSPHLSYKSHHTTIVSALPKHMLLVGKTSYEGLLHILIAHVMLLLDTA